MHSSIGLMETPLALLVVGYGLNQYIKRKTNTWFFFSLVIFIRLELVIFSIIFLINSIFRRNFHWKKVISYSLLGAIPFLTIEFLFFRTIIPNTIIAKSIIYQLTKYTLVRNIFQVTLPNIQILKSLNPYWQIIYISLIITLSVLVVLIMIRKLRDISINHLLVIVGIIISSLVTTQPFESKILKNQDK